ncbi:unnamed protein product [Blepharisma stoltei]|uniref:Uncharacterized protein n=1 Tax=Blepharisma stoltei TaxID=1481888 RepID=A0AAU9IDH0_9CILI|nr:unnamed protein product [Blepharisma stoltei]
MHLLSLQLSTPEHIQVARWWHIECHHRAFIICRDDNFFIAKYDINIHMSMLTETWQRAFTLPKTKRPQLKFEE